MDITFTDDELHCIYKCIAAIAETGKIPAPFGDGRVASHIIWKIRGYKVGQNGRAD